MKRKRRETVEIRQTLLVLSSIEVEMNTTFDFVIFVLVLSAVYISDIAAVKPEINPDKLNYTGDPIVFACFYDEKYNQSIELLFTTQFLTIFSHLPSTVRWYSKLTAIIKLR